MGTMEYYKLIRNSVQLQDVRLISMECRNLISDSNEGEREVTVRVKRSVELLDEQCAEIMMQAWVGFENQDGPFEFQITYGGLCVSDEGLPEEDFKEYAYNQVVPLLLPYVRECVSSTMARMNMPIFYLPTLDVLETLKANEIVE
ncbi:protein-export chaperone SecB [Bacillus mycoides]|uniref:protein-export chaperone SecB n=1 Tax=Bacillus mycoides TaxID=1405 RepID=UPI000278D457|nr:protein-export chaperone SecB [Bacillus mycoides]EJQ61748.1 hypothetical protein IEY_04233 [Bacillus mycoides]EJQ64616.1 hypothetical protein IEW_01100 [Bacillus mycoides]EJV71484.1 hypothetical protein IEU_01101 [Bacillus mycoides]MCD4645432.1 hypothetical protein [Bacillus mycoides]MDR4299647.1 hypothetical protein [Bacillus mycoides]